MLGMSRSVEQLQRPESRTSLNDSASQTRIKQANESINAYHSAVAPAVDRTKVERNSAVRSGSAEPYHVYQHTDPDRYESSNEKSVRPRSNMQIRENLSIDSEAKVRA